MVRYHLVALAFAAVLATGCDWQLSGGAVQPVGYVEVTSAPVGIETYPNTVYEGHTVYLYNERWYYRDGRQWRYYRHEPQPLYQQREKFRRSPPVQHREDRRDDRRYDQHPGDRHGEQYPGGDDHGQHR